MKNILKYIMLFALGFGFLSCEDVVELDLQTAPEKLVIDAFIKVDITQNNDQTIKLSKTRAFYSNTNIPVLNAQVWITDNLNNRYDFYDNSQNGNYVATNFVMDLNNFYTLNVLVDTELYQATANFFNTPNIDEVEQNPNGGFSGEDLEIKIWHNDNIATANYYQLIENSTNYPEYKLSSDEFYNGNRNSFLIFDDELESGDSFEVVLSEVSREYYEYMNRILSVSQNSGNPFASPIGEIRGNILNVTNPENYPLGYFSLQNLKEQTVIVE
nr:DUF4249 domain-containing protein [uncultured Flavobacterium sp.]